MRARTRVSSSRFRRLTLRSAPGTAQRAIPTTDRVKIRPPFCVDTALAFPMPSIHDILDYQPRVTGLFLHEQHC
jgi:hypothetical protein